eukprot:TRINITY_DN5280_c0_g1_i2.p1 TRINITY_DN5280_c0_g1~~TRINITY_DN5280_c0_g1_i2.p1  ORF type:complete len:1101 (+),score=184.73 TRINITY_DN5280_c0_g1_i2:1350-4652(+)
MLERTAAASSSDSFNAVYIIDPISKAPVCITAYLPSQPDPNNPTQVTLRDAPLDLFTRLSANAVQTKYWHLSTGEKYAVAVTALPNSSGLPTAYLVHGVSQEKMTSSIRRALLIQALLIIPAILFDFLLAHTFARFVVFPLRQISRAVSALRGNPTARVAIYQKDEIGILASEFNNMASELESTLAEVEQEQRVTKRLLLNVLPPTVAHELQQQPLRKAIAQSFPFVGILFADVVGYTRMCAQRDAEEMVETLNCIFTAFDDLSEELGIEKIKTIGDAYMAASGLPVRNTKTGIYELCVLALRMQQYLRYCEFQCRFGMDAGPVVAGVIGKRKFLYDVWGDTVNTASRLESNSQPGMITCSSAVAKAGEPHFKFRSRGSIELKGKGQFEAWFLVESAHSLPSSKNFGRIMRQAHIQQSSSPSHKKKSLNFSQPLDLTELAMSPRSFPSPISSPTASNFGRQVDEPEPVPPVVSQSKLGQWFSDMRIRRKQMLLLVLSMILGLGIILPVQVAVIIVTMRKQLLVQAESEVQVLLLSYNIKMDQMGFGFAGQAENAVIRAAVLGTSPVWATVPVLQNEATRRKIEISALLSPNGTVLACGGPWNATGSSFTAYGLVPAAATTKTQLRSTEWISTGDLFGLNKTWCEGSKTYCATDYAQAQAVALVRFIAMPVVDNNVTLGVLLAGDIISSKSVLVERCATALPNTLSSVYMRSAYYPYTDGHPIVSLVKGRYGVTIPGDALRTSPRSSYVRASDGVSYAVASLPLRNFAGLIVGHLAVGTPPGQMIAAVKHVLMIEGILIAAALIVNILLAFVLSSVVVVPLERILQAMRIAHSTRYTNQTEVMYFDEVGQLTAEFNSTVEELRKSLVELEAEKQSAEKLLLNVLPPSVAVDLRTHGKRVIAYSYENVGILFADIVGYTAQCAQSDPAEIVERLDDIFGAFDDLAGKLGIEKIKTIGDAYMAAAGLPLQDGARLSTLQDLCSLALQMQQFMDDNPMSCRLGIDCGKVIAGVIGKHKFLFDIWGDSVNTASRMESHSVPGKITTTARVKEMMIDHFYFEPRGLVNVKGKGDMDLYFLCRPLNTMEVVSPSPCAVDPFYVVPTA